jgi:DNA repair exonuclease SbcCD nuclease subunit
MGFLENFEVPKDGRVHVLLAHGTAIRPFEPQSDSAAAPFDPEHVARSGFALCLAGHIHAGGEIGPVVYPGSPEPLGWGEMGRHAVVVLDTASDAARVTFHDINQRRYVAREIDCDDATSSAVIEQRVKEALTDADPASVYLRLDLKGLIAPDCDLDAGALEDMYRGSYAALQIRDRTFPEYDLAVLDRQNTATGHFVRSLRGRINETTESAPRDQLELALRFGLHALHGRRELIRVD